ncbi:DUF5320 domain-containing protein [Pseudobutyrivibrio sp. MD2005]|uniref:DUF5320 domain-containing protein n=1 Tax=Pseudobutyrivibrio sp. MD2005 TaxID=1410616 RepID=UPI000486C0CE|nr:DUF5320 domain-containing protein [Pseudobutyrivibrio sp. MD2005]
MSDFNNILDEVNEIDPNLGLANSNNDIDDETDQAVRVNTNPIPATTTEEGVALGEAHLSIQAKKQQLIASKVKHWGISFSDSNKMARIKRAIPALDNALTQNMPTQIDSFNDALKHINDLYGEVIDACISYVGNIKTRDRGKSRDGKTRLELTQQVLEQTKKEAGAFQVYATEYFAEHGEEGNPWTSVLYMVRANDLRKDSDSFEEASGGGISTVYRRKVKDNENDKAPNKDKKKDPFKTTYIKAEESLAWKGTYDSAIELYLSSGAPKAKEIVDAYKKAEKGLCNNINYVWDSVDRALDLDLNEKLNKSHKEYLQYEAEKREQNLNLAINYLSTYKETQIFINENREAIKVFLTYIHRKAAEFNVATKSAGIAPGSIISNRNVSTSRVAKKLGVKDVVAESQTILMKDKNGSMIKANEMEDAGSNNLHDTLMRAKRHKLDVVFTPRALKQAWELQVLDLICGQVDRHINNYSVDAELDHKRCQMIVKSVKGFDNDMSFGAKTLSAMNKSPHVKSLVSDGKISVPYLSRSFYENIMAYTPEMAESEQLDIRSKEEIKALQSRLKDIQAQLKKLVDDNKIQLLDNDAQWLAAARNYYANIDTNEKYYADSYVVLKLN